MNRRPAVLLLVALAAVVLATPLSAYTVFLKDGSTIAAKDEPEVDEAKGRVIITQLSGVETSLPIEEVDFERTRDFNEKNFDGALVIDGGETKGLAIEAPEKKPRLGDKIVEGTADIRVRDPHVRPRTRRLDEPRRTAGGLVDFDDIDRRAYGDAGIASELQSYFTAQGLEAHVFSGTRNSHLLVEVVTSSESAVFKSLQVAAQALPQVRDRHASRIAALELLLKTDRGSGAGQFVLTPELAGSLNSGEIDVPTFFLRHVRF